MTVHKGATHIDYQGNYFRHEDNSGCFTKFYESAGTWGVPELYDPSSFHALGMKRIHREAEYHGQFEPWQPNTYVEAGMPDIGVKPAQVANNAIQEIIQ